MQSQCSFPEHHKPGSRFWLVLAALVGGVLARHRVASAAAVALHVLVVVGLVLAVLGVAGLAATLAIRHHNRRAPAGATTSSPSSSARPDLISHVENQDGHRGGARRGARRFAFADNVLRAIWAASRWRWFTRNAGLARPDKHAKDKGGRKVLRTRARIWPARFGLTARVRVRPGAGRAEFEAAASALADHWRCERVGVSQARPGRLLIRGLVKDPLLVRFGTEVAPPGVYDGLGSSRLWLGRDEFGSDRWLELANVSGIVVGGLPGAGKSVALTSWLMQKAGNPACQFVTLDGKGAGEFDDFSGRAWMTGGDSLEGAVAMLEELHELMTRRLASVRSVLGVRNAWHVGPSLDWPVIFSVLDECQQFLDAVAVKGDKKAEPLVRRCQALVSSLIRRGRSVMLVTVVGTQKPTTDSLPSSSRDNAAVSLAFGLKTTDAAVATLGPDIREYPSFSPVGFADPQFAGCCVTTLRTAGDPFTRIRTPMVTEAAAAERASSTGRLRRDPLASLPDVKPDLPELVKVPS